MRLVIVGPDAGGEMDVIFANCAKSAVFVPPDAVVALLGLTGIPFTKYHLDDFTHAGETFHRSAHLKS